MDSSELYSNSYDVFTGFWTNWSHGAIRGATITLTKQYGGFLIAFLAIYVGMVGKSFWRLGCFALHLGFSSSEPGDGLYHQRQAILRNSDTAQDGAWRLLVSMVSWRRRARKPILRLLPLTLLAFLISAAFGIASVFSSNVTTDTANEVILRGDRCGRLSRTKPNNVTAVYALFKPYHAQLSTKLLTYGLTCYTNSSDQNRENCNRYIKPELPLKVDRKAACPFSETICKTKENLVLDTGRLHSLHHLGINTAPKDQFEVRLLHKCAPLVSEGFTELADDVNMGRVARMMYGEASNGAYNYMPWTFQVPLDFPYNPANFTGYIGTSVPEYKLGQQSALSGEEGGGPGVRLWNPIPELYLPDSDVFMMFLSAPGVRFSAPVDDPWFSAHQNASTLYDQNNNTRPSWVSDSPVTSMACTMQMQYCNPRRPESERCEPLRGPWHPNKETTLPELFRSKSQLDIVSRADFMLGLDTANPHLLSGSIGAAALRARLGQTGGYQGPLPSNQWQLEAEHWIKGELASIQDLYVRAAAGPPKELEPFLVRPEKNETAALSICHNQKFVSTRYSSFNVLGVSLILLLGGLIILFDIFLEPVIGSIKKRKYLKQLQNNKTHHSSLHPLRAILEWSATSTLQLQRLAHEEAGYGKWENCNGANPVTRSGEKLALLDICDIEKPFLKQKSPLTRINTGLDTLVEEQGTPKKVKEEHDMIFHVVERQSPEGNLRN